LGLKFYDTGFCDLIYLSKHQANTVKLFTLIKKPF
jgi:hypothetical protein